MKFHLGAVSLNPIRAVGENGGHRYMHNEQPAMTGIWVVPRNAATLFVPDAVLIQRQRRKAFFMRSFCSRALGGDTTKQQERKDIA